MGSAAAWALAARGRDVTLLEQFTPGHHKGASHGATRNLSLAYAEPEYVAMLAETLKLWAELEVESGEQLLARTGVVNHGPDPHLGEIHAALNSAGLRADFVPLAEAGERWRGIRFDQQVLHMPDGGQINPEAALPAFQRLAARNGAAIRHGAKVVGLDILDDGVRLTVDDGGRTEVLTARQAVVWKTVPDFVTARAQLRGTAANFTAPRAVILGTGPDFAARRAVVLWTVLRFTAPRAQVLGTAPENEICKVTTSKCAG